MVTAKQIARSDRWLFLGIDVIVVMICYGPLSAFGAVFDKMMETFQTDRAETAVVQSVHIGVTYSFGLVSGALVTKLGPTTVLLLASVLYPLGFCIAYFAMSVLYLSLSIGVISGAGVSMILVSSFVATERIFDGSQRLLCLSVVTTAASIPAVFYSYFLRWLSESYGLKGMFLIQGGLACNVFVLYTYCRTNKVVVRSLTKHTPEDVTTAESNENNACTKMDLNKLKSSFVSSVKGLCTKPYVFVLVSTGLSLASLDSYLGLMFDIGLGKGLSSSQGLASFVVFYSFTATSSLLAGILKQKKGVNSLVYPIMSTSCGWIGSLVIYCTSKYVAFMTGTAIIGAALGGIAAASVNAAVQIVNEKQVPLALGLLHTLEGLLSIGTGPFFGSIRDEFGSYEIVLLILIGIQIVCTVLFMFALIFHKKQKEKEKRDTKVILTTTRL